MKKSIIIILLLVFNLTVCQKKETSPVSKIYQYMPENTIFFLKFSSIEKVFKTFSIGNIKDFDKDIKKDLENTKEKLGINPFDLNELQKIGLDINKECGFFISNFKKNKNYSANFNFFFPTKQPENFIKTIKQVISKKEKNIEWKKKSGIIYSSLAKENIGITTKNEIVFITIKEYKLKPENFIKKDKLTDTSNIQEELSKKDINNFLTSLKFKKSLWDNPSFKKTVSKINTNEDLSSYINFSQVFSKSNVNTLKEMLPEKEKKAQENLFKLLNDYQDFFCTIDFDSNDFLLNYLLKIREGSKIEKLYDFKFNKDPLLSVSKMPILLMAAGINFQEYEKYLKTIFKKTESIDYNKIFKEFKEQTELDLRQDIINNLAGSFNYAFFDGKTCNMFNINGFLSVSIKNEKKMNKVIDHLITKLTKKIKIPIIEEKIDNITVKALNIQFYKIYYTVYNKNLIITSRKEYLQNVITGSTSSGFTANIDKNLAEKLKGDSYNFYLDFNQLSLAIDSFLAGRPVGSMPVVNKIKKSLSKLNYLIYNTYYKNNILYADFKIKTYYKNPFFIELTKTFKKYMAEEIKKKKKKQAENKNI